MVHSLVLGEPAVNLYKTKASEAEARARDAVSLTAIDSARAQFAKGDDLAALRTFFDGTIGAGAFDAAPDAMRNYLKSQVFELRKEMTIPADRWLPRRTCRDFRTLKMPILLLIG